MAQTRVGHHIEQLIVGTPLYKECKTWLDIGCGDGTTCTTMQLNWLPDKTGIDPKPWESGPDWKLIKGIYKPDCEIWYNHFDIITALDVIEHLTREEGERLLEHLEKVADKLIILQTPDGFLPQGPLQDPKFDEWDTHRSGWKAEDFLSRGYCVWRTPLDFHHNPTGLLGDWSALLVWKNKAI